MARVYVERRELPAELLRLLEANPAAAECAPPLDVIESEAGIEAILGSDLKTKNYAADEWLGFNPAFVYRHRPVKRSVSTAKLAEALAAMTRRVDDFADKVGYDAG